MGAGAEMTTRGEGHERAGAGALVGLIDECTAWADLFGAIPLSSSH
jgi:hypothetical protein